jgi:hypothetical protein
MGTYCPLAQPGPQNSLDASSLLLRPHRVEREKGRSRRREQRVGDGVRARGRTREVPPDRGLGANSASEPGSVHLERSGKISRVIETSVGVVARRPAGFKNALVDLWGLNWTKKATRAMCQP